jgi:hypothetical protein
VGFGSDEPYFLVSVAPLNPEADNRTEIDGTCVSILPAGVGTYEDVDTGHTRDDSEPVYLGRATPLVVQVIEFEHDNGDPNAFRNEIKVAVQVVGGVVAAFAPAASFVALNPEVHEAVTTVINGVAGTGDDVLDIGEFRLGSRRRILEALNTPEHEEFGIPIHQKVFLTDGDASYDAYFRWRRLDHF